MSETTGPSPGPASPTGTFADLWFDYFEHSGEQSKAWLSNLQAAGDPRKLQEAWLETLSKSFDSYLRGPAFRDFLRQNLEAVTRMKQAQNQVTEDWARQVGVPLASDIFGLFERIKSMERTTLARLSALEARCIALETMLAEARKPPDNP